mmetsp:Transcript_27369/g.31302  ORF Transcript_27369/g.31302 Transcript_27369/m.31302 type:complete len:501 (-) Transcript_27369:113-1615(-)
MAEATSKSPQEHSKILTPAQINIRPFGSKYKCSNLPSHLPIVGLGCSSFSTFFFSNDDDDENENDALKHDITQANVQNIVKASIPIVNDWIKTIRYAIENGIILLDTAPWYGHGTSEVVIGLAMENYLNVRINREDIIINTKVGRYDADPKNQFDFSYDKVMVSVKRSLERMKCCYIDVIQLHDPEFAPSMEILIEETIPALLQCRQEKLVKAIGLTGYPLEVQYTILKQVELKMPQKVGGNGNMLVFDQCLTYSHFNLHSQALFTNGMNTIINKRKRTNERRASHLLTGAIHASQGKSPNDENSCDNNMTFAQYCHYKSIPIMAAAPLSMGLLTHSKPPEWHPAPKELQAACKKASEIAKSFDVDLPTLALMYALVHSGISCTLLGMANIGQVDAALDVAKRLGDTELQFHDYTSINNDKDLRIQMKRVLDNVLRVNEKKLLDLLLDDVSGPFSQVWKTGEYEWDGVEEAETFWSSISDWRNSDEARQEAERRMREKAI